MARTPRPSGRHPLSTLATNADILAELQEAVDAANKTVSKAEAIKSSRCSTPTSPSRPVN